MKTCVICATEGAIEPGRTTSTMTRGRATVVVREVPALICGNCGEAYVEGDVADRLLEIAEPFFRSGADVAVSDYEKRVAA